MAIILLLAAIFLPSTVNAVGVAIGLLIFSLIVGFPSKIEAARFFGMAQPSFLEYLLVSIVSAAVIIALGRFIRWAAIALTRWCRKA